MIEYVVIGCNAFIGELEEIIHLNGGIISTIVLNVEDKPKPRRVPIQTKIAALPYYVETLLLSDYKPKLRVDGRFLSHFNPRHVFGFCHPSIEQITAWLDQCVKGVWDGLTYHPLVHPSAIVARTVTIGRGTVIGAGSIIASGAKLGEFNRINRGVTIGHDTRLGKFVSVNPGANIAGNVRIGDNVTVNMGTNIAEDLVIGDNAVIGAGAVVIEDVPENVLMVGVPAKVKRQL